MRTQGADGLEHAKEGGLRRNQPAHTGTSHSRLQDREGVTLCRLAPGLWHFVQQSQDTDTDRGALPAPVEDTQLLLHSAR